MNTCPLNSIESALAFSSRDWSTGNREAWIYGVVLGWDDDSLAELKQLHGWSSDTIERLKMLHNKWKALKI